MVVYENPQLWLTPEELKSIERNRAIREKFEAAVLAEEEKFQRGLSGDERLMIRKRILAEEP